MIGAQGNTAAPAATGTHTRPAFDLGGLYGLSADDARARWQTEGPNELPAQKPRSLFAIGFEVVREPMFLMLVAAGGLYLLMGEPADALMLLGFVFVVMGITLVQERRTERALEALRDLSSPRALVIRDGEQRRIAGPRGGARRPRRARRGRPRPGRRRSCDAASTCRPTSRC